MIGNISLKRENLEDVIACSIGEFLMDLTSSLALVECLQGLCISWGGYWDSSLSIYSTYIPLFMGLIENPTQGFFLSFSCMHSWKREEMEDFSSTLVAL